MKLEDSVIETETPVVEIEAPPAAPLSEPLPPYPQNEDQQRLTISRVSERGAFNITSEESFYFTENLKTFLIDEPENRTTVLNVTVLQLGEVED